jgi:hypothetical protein
MLTKNNSLIIAIFFVVTAFHSAEVFAVGEARQIKFLYGELMRIQGINSPYDAVGKYRCGHEEEINQNTYKKSAASAFHSTGALFRTMFQAAGQTGLIAQYRQLITSNNALFSMNFLDKSHLQVVAYMQNLYGKGQPFTYDPIGKLPVLVGASNYYQDSPVIGNYINPQGQNLIMTRYGILNGIIDQLGVLEQDQRVASSEEFQDFCNVLLMNLTEAIKLSCREKLYLLEAKIVCSFDIDQNFISKVTPLVDSINKIKDLLVQ